MFLILLSSQLRPFGVSLFDFQQGRQGFPESFDKVAHRRGLQDRRDPTVGVLHFSTRVLVSEIDWMPGAT